MKADWCLHVSSQQNSERLSYKWDKWVILRNVRGKRLMSVMLFLAQQANVFLQEKLTQDIFSLEGTKQAKECLSDVIFLLSNQDDDKLTAAHMAQECVKYYK